MEKDELHLRDYLVVLGKRKWTVAAVSTAVFFTVAAATFMATPLYRSTARIYVDPGASALYSIQQLQLATDTNYYIQTQLGILKSETIARKVVEKLGLDKGPAERGLFSPAALLSMLGGAGEGPSPAGNTEAAVRRFRKTLKAEAVKNSNLILVSYDDYDPAVAARVVNAAVQAFIEQNLDMKVAPAKEAMTWLNSRLGEIKGQMTESAAQLQDFKRSKELIVTGDKQENISLQALSDLNAKALTAETRRYEAEVKYQQVQKLSKARDGLMSLPEVINNKLIQDLKSQQGSLAKEMAEQSKKFGERHPQMVRLRNETDQLKRQVQTEVDLIVSSIRNNYETALKEEQNIKRALSQQKTEAMSYERRSTEYDLMRQDVEGSREIYDTVLKKFQESNIMGNMNMSNVQLLDKALPQDRPFRPKKALNLLLGLFFGVFSGVGFAFFFEYLDNTYKSAEDIEGRLGLPFLGAVPSIKGLSEAAGNLVSVADPKSAASEAFRNIRGNILLSSGDIKPKVIQVCSSVHSEGKSTVSVNLAGIMAAAGEDVLLVDADMRKPRLHKVFRLANRSGLSSVLSGQAALGDVTVSTGIPGLSIITSGPVSPNPGELLGSKAMKQSIAQLYARFDRIIIDCPPMMGLADSSLLSPLTEGIIFVIRSGRTGRDVVYKAKKGLDTIKARVLGAVLNDVTAKSQEYYYYNYNYYYGEKKTAEN